MKKQLWAKKNKKILYLLRHGKTSISSKRYLGQMDISLNHYGYLQAKYWHKYFSHTKFDGIYSSTLNRAIQTALIISRGHNINIEYSRKLKEINLGKWDGLSFETIRRSFPFSFYARGINPEHYRPPKGENFHDLEIRAISVLDKIIKKTKKRALIVSHAGVIRVILASILKMPLKNIFEIKQDHAAMNKILVTENSKKIIAINCTPKDTIN